MTELPPVARMTSAKGKWLLAVLSLLAFATLIALGNWQMRRLEWKEDLLASISERMSQEPQPLSDVEALYERIEDVGYLPTTASGVFNHAKEQHYFATHKGASGYYVYTPLHLEDGRWLLVNRGFVPFDRKDPASRQKGQVEGQVKITGLARNPLIEKPSGVYDNDPEANIYYWKDLKQMSAYSGLEGKDVLPFFLDADDAVNPGELPVGGVTRVNLPNNHLQYAMTWYGLALALAGVWLAFMIRRRS